MLFFKNFVVVHMFAPWYFQHFSAELYFCFKRWGVSPAVHCHFWRPILHNVCILFWFLMKFSCYIIVWLAFDFSMRLRILVPDFPALFRLVRYANVHAFYILARRVRILFFLTISPSVCWQSIFSSLLSFIFTTFVLCMTTNCIRQQGL